MIDYFKNIFIEDKEWVRENTFNKSIVEARDQFNGKFNSLEKEEPSLSDQFDNSRKKNKLMAIIKYVYNEEYNTLLIDFKISKGYNELHTLFKTTQEVGDESVIKITYNGDSYKLSKEEFDEFLVNKVFGSKRFAIIISQLSLLDNA